MLDDDDARIRGKGDKGGHGEQKSARTASDTSRRLEEMTWEMDLENVRDVRQLEALFGSHFP